MREEYGLGMIDMSLGIGKLVHDIKETTVHYTILYPSHHRSPLTKQKTPSIVHLTIMGNGIAINGD